jgi:hypothetical protein
MNSKVTAVSADGRRSTLEVEARSLNYAAIEYNYRTVGNTQGPIVRGPKTVFEIETKKVTYFKSWARVLRWAASVATATNERWPRGE